jgi:peptidoglycan/LPS O-acetylase OafA/YrhL
VTAKTSAKPSLAPRIEPASSGSALRDAGFYIPSFDGVRALSIIAVVATHVKIPFFHLKQGWYGVDCFFVLSGFLITWILAGEIERLGTIRVRRFYLRRVLRLQPAYFSSLFWSFAFGLLFARSAMRRTWESLPFLLTYSYNFSRAIGLIPGTPLPPAWSLCIEEQFYFCWPLILRKLGLRKGFWFAVGAVCLVGAFRTGLYMWFAGGLSRPVAGVAEGFLAYSTFTRVDTIFVGCALALALKDKELGPRLERLAMRPWFPFVMTVSAIAVIVWGTGGVSAASPRALNIGGTIMAIADGGVILALFVRPDSAISRALSIRPLTFVGEISYGIYLFHPLVRVIIGMILGAVHISPFGLKLLFFPLTLSVSILVAWIHYNLVEKYFLSLRERIEQWSRTRAAQPAAPVPEAAEGGIGR